MKRIERGGKRGGKDCYALFTTKPLSLLSFLGGFVPFSVGLRTYVKYVLVRKDNSDPAAYADVDQVGPRRAARLVSTAYCKNNLHTEMAVHLPSLHALSLPTE